MCIFISNRDYIDHYLIYKNKSFEIFLYIYIKLNIFDDSYFLKFDKFDFQCNLDWKLLHARLFEIILMMSILFMSEENYKVISFETFLLVNFLFLKF